jgi:hypothetical protein
LANTDGMKEKFTVLKNDDLRGALQGVDNEDLRESFDDILRMIRMYREAIDKPTNNKYLVINIDEPYADEVIEILKRNGHWG